MWSEWNAQYVKSDYPRLIVRFEDNLIHAERVMELISECVGKPMQNPFVYHLDASKGHGNSSDFLGALSKYGRGKGRYDGLLVTDQAYAKTALSPDLLETFHYPPIETSSNPFAAGE
jgi:hypothetical protein